MTAVTAFHPGSLMVRRLRYHLPLHFFTLPRLRRKNADLPSTVVPYRAITGVSSARIAVMTPSSPSLKSMACAKPSPNDSICFPLAHATPQFEIGPAEVTVTGLVVREARNSEGGTRGAGAMSGFLGAHDGDDARATRAPTFNDEALTTQQ